MPEVGAAREGRVGSGRDLEVGALEPLGGAPVADLRELEPPAGPVGDRGRPGDRQRRRIGLSVQDGPGRVAVLRPIGQDLDPDGATQAVDAADERDDEPVGPRADGVAELRLGPR